MTDRDDKAFHSFRHVFTRTLRQAKVAETTIEAPVGHANDSDVTSGYDGDDEGFLFDRGVLADAVEMISFPEHDLSRLGGFLKRSVGDQVEVQEAGFGLSHPRFAPRPVGASSPVHESY